MLLLLLLLQSSLAVAVAEAVEFLFWTKNKRFRSVNSCGRLAIRTFSYPALRRVFNRTSSMTFSMIRNLWLVFEFQFAFAVGTIALSCSVSIFIRTSSVVVSENKAWGWYPFRALYVWQHGTRARGAPPPPSLFVVAVAEIAMSIK